MWFVVIDSPKCRSYREKVFNLNNKQLHITLSFITNDIHGDVDKGPSSLIHTDLSYLITILNDKALSTIYRRSDNPRFGLSLASTH